MTRRAGRVYRELVGTMSYCYRTNTNSAIRLAVAGGLILSTLMPVLANTMSAQERMQFADGLFARELYNLAIEEYTKLLEAEPSHPAADAAHYRLGDAYRHLGDSGQAQKQYAKVFKLFPESEYAAKAGVKRADIFISEKRYEDGVELYRMVLERKPGEPVASACHYFIGDALLAVNKTNAAEKAYGVIANDFPSSDYAPFALLRLAEIGAARGESPGRVLRYYRAAATNTISDRVAAEALYQIGRLEFERSSFEESSRAFAELARQYPEDKRARESKLDAAWAQYNAGYTAKALEVAETALQGEEQSVEMKRHWLYLKANSERALKKNRDAVRTYSFLIEMGGGNSYAYVYERALCYFALEEYESVLSSVEGGDWKESKVAEDVLWLKGRASEEAERNDQAVQFYRKLLKEFPEGRFIEQVSFRLAGILRSRKDWKGAAGLYAEVAQRFSKGALAPKALLACGLCRMEAGQLEEAASAWREMVSKYSEHELVPESLLNLAAAEVRLKRMKEAEVTVDLLLRRYAEDAKANEAWFWKGLIAAERGQHKSAEQSFGKSLELGLEGTMAAKARAYRALAIYRAGDEKRAADELQRLSGEEELKSAGRNIFTWLAGYRLNQNDGRKSVDAAEKLQRLSELPVERQEAFCFQGRANGLAGSEKESLKMFAAAYQIEEESLFKAEAALSLGEGALKAQDLEAAQEYFAAAAELALGGEGVPVRARAYLGLGDTAELKKDYEKAARYFMSVAVLFEDKVLVPRALASAARAYGLAGMKREGDKALEELSRRYPSGGDGGGNDE